MDKKRQFEENVLGTAWSGSGSVSKKGDALRNFKLADRYNDKTTMRKYLRQYQELGGTPKGFETPIRSMAPGGGLSDENRKRFYAWLSEQDRKYLQKAEKYYQDLRRRLGEIGE